MSEERVIPMLLVKKSPLLLLLGPKEKTGFIVAKTSCRMTECAQLHTKSGPSTVQSPPCSYKLSLVCTFPTRFQSSLCPPPNRPPLYTSVLICVFCNSLFISLLCTNLNNVLHSALIRFLFVKLYHC